MRKIYPKKGELTTQQLVTIIILITSFVIVLFLFYRLNLGETTDKEICHNSVVLQEQSQLTSGNLDCRTNYLCISGGSKCTDINQKTEISVDPTNKTQIFKALADEMSDCWWQFGEGKINYGDKALFEVDAQYALCSIMVFDDKVHEKLPEIKYLDFYNYLRTTPKTESQTYLQYLYGVTDLSQIPATYTIAMNVASDRFDTSKAYTVITGIKNNPSPIDDVKLKVYIIPTSETESRLVANKIFITKA